MIKGAPLAGPVDYIIVGAGSAGCVLANRLSRDASHRVALLEAGGSDRSVFVQMPTALSIPMNMPRFNWGYESQAEPGLGGRRLDCPRGRVLGGSSSINGMVYVRGHACDFDQWEAAGASGWGYRHCLPYFRRAEGWVGGSDEYRGDDGPLAVCNGNQMQLSPLYRAFIDAGCEAGYPATGDYNGFRQEGFGPMHMTVRNGVRASSANAYLRPVLQRKNLQLSTAVMVHRVLFDGVKAVGVEYEVAGKRHTLTARREVILCAGAIGSPQLLQLSGIGPAQHLRDVGVTALVDRPGVGANLQDHLEVYFQFRCLQPITLNGRLGWLSKALIGARWLLSHSGLGATNHFEACGFIRSRAGVKWPDIQYHFLPAAIRYDGRAAFADHGFQVHVGPNKPRSRGTVLISHADARTHPQIQFNYLSDDRDVRDWRACIRLTREILMQPALDPFRGEEIQPGAAVQGDDAIDAWVRENVESAYHPSCTCAMGARDDPNAVVDPQCRVIGRENLRVIDSSVFPTIPNGNLNGPTIMVAEKAADLILGREPLAPSNAPAWIDPQWETRQRPGQPARQVAAH